MLTAFLSFHKLIFSKISWIGFALFLVNGLTFAQPATISKTLPEPVFYVLGIAEKGFPEYTGSWRDTLSLKAYGNKVNHWLQQNPSFYQKQLSEHNTPVQINRDFFTSLNSEQKQRFKEVSAEIAFILKPQKNLLIKTFNKSHIDLKKGSPDFYREGKQVYFLHIQTVESLMKRIKG